MTIHPSVQGFGRILIDNSALLPDHLRGRDDILAERLQSLQALDGRLMLGLGQHVELKAGRRRFQGKPEARLFDYLLQAPFAPIDLYAQAVSARLTAVANDPGLRWADGDRPSGVDIAMLTAAYTLAHQGFPTALYAADTNLRLLHENAKATLYSPRRMRIFGDLASDVSKHVRRVA